MLLRRAARIAQPRSHGSKRCSRASACGDTSGPLKCAAARCFPTARALLFRAYSEEVSMKSRLLAASFVLASCGLAFAQSPVTVRLGEQNHSGETGTATLTAEGSSTKVEL